MVKFGKYLGSHQITEWSSQYVRYKGLKKLLKQAELEQDERDRAEAAASAGIEAASLMGTAGSPADSPSPFPSNPQLLQFTPAQKKAIAAVRAKKAILRRLTVGSAQAPTPDVDAQLRTGHEFIARSKAAVRATEQRIEQKANGRESSVSRSARVAEVELTVLGDQPHSSGRISPSIHDRLGLTDAELAADDADGMSDAPSLDVVLSHGRKHQTDAVLVAEDRNVHRLRRYIPSEFSSAFTPGEQSFFRLLEEDVLTVNRFFLRQENFFLDKMNVLVEQLDRLLKAEEARMRAGGITPPSEQRASIERMQAMVAAAQRRENARNGGGEGDVASHAFELAAVNREALRDQQSPGWTDAADAAEASVAAAWNESNDDVLEGMDPAFHEELALASPPAAPPAPPSVPSPPPAADNDEDNIGDDADDDDDEEDENDESMTRESHSVTHRHQSARVETRSLLTTASAAPPSPARRVDVASADVGDINESGASESDGGGGGGVASVASEVASLAQHMHLHLKFRLLTAQKPWRVLEKALVELYRGLQLLRNYKILNFTAFVKILKKYDKLALRGDDAFRAGATLLPRIQSTHFLASPILKSFIRRVELIFASTFTDGDRKVAIDKLRVVQAPLKSETMFQLGLLLGMSGIFAVVMAFLVGWLVTQRIALTFQVTLPVWRGLALVILHFWGWCINVYLFRRYRLNHIFIFEIDTRTSLKFEQLVVGAAGMSTLWLAMIDLYIAIGILKHIGAWEAAVPGWSPFILFCVFFFVCFMPFDVFFRPTRMYIVRILGQIVTAPFHFVNFKDFYVGNQLTSLSNVLNDVLFSFCYLGSGHFLSDATSDAQCTYVQSQTVWCLALLPYWWRFLQCLRRYRDNPVANRMQAVNAGKYFSSLITSLMSLFHKHYPDSVFLYLWICAAVVATVYNFLWDVCCDWGVVSFDGIRPRFLQRKLVLKNHLWYYAGIACDCFLRVAWVFTISPSGFGIHVQKDLWSSIIYTLEIVRRNIWNFFRLENEHLTNCERYRVVNIVPLAMPEESADEGAADNAKREEGIRRSLVSLTATGGGGSNAAMRSQRALQSIEEHDPAATLSSDTAVAHSQLLTPLRHADHFARQFSPAASPDDGFDNDYDDALRQAMAFHRDSSSTMPPDSPLPDEEEQEAIQNIKVHLSPSVHHATRLKQNGGDEVAAGANEKEQRLVEPIALRMAPVNEIRIQLPADSNLSSYQPPSMQSGPDLHVGAPASNLPLYGDDSTSSGWVSPPSSASSPAPLDDSSIMRRARRMSYSAVDNTADDDVDPTGQAHEDDAMRTSLFEQPASAHASRISHATRAAVAHAHAKEEQAADDMLDRVLARRRRSLSGPSQLQAAAAQVPPSPSQTPAKLMLTAGHLPTTTTATAYLDVPDATVTAAADNQQSARQEQL